MNDETAANHSPPEPMQRVPAADARHLVRRALKASLATLDRLSGHPYASLVTVATDADGKPVLLLSRLARHTENLLADPRVSLLFDGTGSDGDPLAGGRVTLTGTIGPIGSDAARRRFLARHPAAAMYAGFSDFAFYALQTGSAHYIGGFGRIIDIAGHELLTSLEGAEALVAAEPEILEHMNSDHRDAVALYATRLLSAPTAQWTMTGIDPAGFDLAGGGQSLRFDFDSPISTPDDARRELARLARTARSRC